MNELILNEAIYERIIQTEIPLAEQFVWIVTADIKDMHVKRGKRYLPFLSVLADLVRRGVGVRLIHAKEPGPRFREDFDKYPELSDSDLFERILCPRVHTKCILIDGRLVYVGSANLTGEGMGAKSPNRRNFEAGFFTDEVQHVQTMMDFVDALYLGNFCLKCGRRNVCPDPIV